MSGELWRGTFQLGKETTPGVATAATRVLYVDPTSMLTRARPPHPKPFMTTTRDNIRALTVGPVAAGGSMKLPVSAAELLEPFCIGIQASPTPTTPAGGTASKQFVFRPGSTAPDSATIEWQDDARVWQGSGYQVDTISIDGSVLGENIATIGLFGQNMIPLGAITGSLTQRTPTFFEGWETRLYLDAAGATPGTTQIPGQLINWSIKYGNQLSRKYTASNTLSASGTPIGSMVCTGDLTFEAAASTTLTEYNNWENGSAAPTRRVMRLQFGDNTALEASSTSVGTATTAEVGNVATYTVANTLKPGDRVTVTGASVAGYNGANLIVNTATGSLFTVILPTTGLGAATGAVTVGPNIMSKVMLDIPCAWTTVDLGQSDSGTRVYKFSFTYVFDPTLGYGFSATCVTDRTTLF